MKNIDMNRVKHLYYTEQKSAFEVGLELGVSARTILDRMHAAGMKPRTLSDAQKVRRQIMKYLDVDRAAHLYFEKEWSLKKIGEIFGVSETTVGNRLKAAGYVLRCNYKRSKFSDSDIAEMVRLYCEGLESSKEIAYRYGCCDVTIRHRLKAQGVRLRTAKECQEIRRKKEAAAKAKASVPVPKETVTPAFIVQLREDENLTIDAIANRCDLENMEVYEILQGANAL